MITVTFLRQTGYNKTNKNTRRRIMERSILTKLLNWKNSPYRKPLILKGVRQVGKTWILKEFGKRYYEWTVPQRIDKEIKTLSQNIFRLHGFAPDFKRSKAVFQIDAFIIIEMNIFSRCLLYLCLTGKLHPM